MFGTAAKSLSLKLSLKVIEEELPLLINPPDITVIMSSPFEPNVCSIWVVVLCPMLMITITDATPMMIPKRERNVRILLRLKFWSEFKKSSSILFLLPLAFKTGRHLF